MKKVYPVIFTPVNENHFNGYDVYVPDFPLNTQGKDLAEAIYMAREAISAMGIYFQDENKPIPEPSDLHSYTSDTGIVSLVDVDFDAYRKAHDNRTVRRNITLPAWLDDEATKAKINVSGVVQRALKTELHIDH